MSSYLLIAHTNEYEYWLTPSGQFSTFSEEAKRFAARGEVESAKIAWENYYAANPAPSELEIYDFEIQEVMP